MPPTLSRSAHHTQRRAGDAVGVGKSYHHPGSTNGAIAYATITS